jgi:hypothetical protein
VEGREENALTGKIIGCCYRVHTALGPGFKEKNYQLALEIALKKEGSILFLKNVSNCFFWVNWLVCLDAILLLKMRL